MHRFTLTILACFCALALAAQLAASKAEAAKVNWRDRIDAAAGIDAIVVQSLVQIAAAEESEANKKTKELEPHQATRKKAIADALEAAGDTHLKDLRSHFEHEILPVWRERFKSRMDGELPKNAIAAKELSALVGDFSLAWGVLYLKNGKAETSVNDLTAATISKYLALSDLSQFAERPKPFEGFADEAAKEAFVVMLKRVAAFIPDKRTAALFDPEGKPKEKGHLDNAIKDNDPLEIRACVNDVVDDLNNTYKGHIEATKALRLAVVREYSEATTLGSTGTFATLMAVLGSVLLFGGLALAIFKAMSGKAATADA
ncbi:MAG: hypothetical protein KDB07_12780 [Planctomycetes bacterium]|nr:hypothetical protein [Planctomycetota bacterium]